MAIERHTEIKQLRVIPVPAQAGPNGEPMPSEWRVNVYMEVSFGDPEDPAMDTVRTPHVKTYRQGDDYSAAEPEVQSLCAAVFTVGSPFYPAPAEPELA